MKTKNQETIFSIGVHLKSIECAIDGQKQWRWIAVGFEDDSFMNGETINPIEYADKQKDLIGKFDDI